MYFLLFFIQVFLFIHFVDEVFSQPTLPYQPGPPSHYLENIRSGRKMLEEVYVNHSCENSCFININGFHLFSKKKLIQMHQYMETGQLKMLKVVFINIYKKIIYHKNTNTHQADQTIFGLLTF